MKHCRMATREAMGGHAAMFAGQPAHRLSHVPSRPENALGRGAWPQSVARRVRPQVRIVAWIRRSLIGRQMQHGPVPAQRGRRPSGGPTWQTGSVLASNRSHPRPPPNRCVGTRVDLLAPPKRPTGAARALEHTGAVTYDGPRVLTVSTRLCNQMAARRRHPREN